MMEQNKALILMTVILNAVVIICFTVLAMEFHKWWIVLFSILWFVSLKEE